MSVTIALVLFWSARLTVYCCTENIIHGYRLDGFTAEEIPHIGVHTCVKECLLRKHCQSVNYNTQQFSCEINDKSADIIVEGTSNPDFFFSNVANSTTEELLGHCRHSQCPSSYKCVSTHDSAACLSVGCAVGTYGKDGQCIPCPVGQYNSGSSMQWCLICQPGTYQDQPGSSSCKACPSGTHQPKKGKSSCDPCPVGQHSPNEGSLHCLNCPPGTYQDQTRSSVCKLCPTGTHQPEEKKTICDPCPVGQHSPNEGRLHCLNCPPGTYQDQTKSSDCKHCPSGTHQPNQGETNEDSCIPCAPGTYQPYTGRGHCAQCSAGYYQPDAGETSCLLCPEDNYQDLKGQTTCKDCSRLNKCTNKNRTMCYDLQKNDRRFGDNHVSHGSQPRTKCKQLCWTDVNCQGFSVRRHSDPGYCYTHTSSGFDYNEDYNYYRFTYQCHS